MGALFILLYFVAFAHVSYSPRSFILNISAKELTVYAKDVY